MGTRGAIGFRFKGEDKLTYNHWDSYPSSLGVVAMRAIAKWNDEQLAGAAARIELVQEGSVPSEQDVKRYAPVTDLGVSQQSDTDWYCVLRGVQGVLDPYVDGTVDHMIDSADFMKDSLFCEWAYILNMDERKLEFYRGFNQSPDAPGRYAATHRERNGDYWGVAYVTSMAFDDIRKLTDAGIQEACDLLEESVSKVEEAKYLAETRGITSGN